jgi:signal transduction histidine kinase
VRRRGIFFFFLLPFMGVLLLFLILSFLNRAFIRQKADQLAREQLLASAAILSVSIQHSLDDGSRPEGLIGRYGGEENIYFMALLNDRDEVIDWTSRFEGYLPFSRRSPAGEEAWTIDSPAGTILNILKPITGKSGARYSLYLGYSLSGLDDMVAHSRTNFILLFSALSVVGLLFFFGIYTMHRNSLARAEEAMAEKKEKERFKAISGFTAGVSHEIKNPLNSLSLLFEYLSRRAPGELQADLDLGRDEIQKIARIVDVFSEELKPLALNRTAGRLNDIVNDVQKSLAAEFRGKNAPIRYFEKKPLAFNGDRNLLEQAFKNIVKNSLEATSQGAVEIEAEPSERGIVVRIKDTGAGIASEDVERIFEPFYSTKTTGMGIGLYLVKKIIDAHGGSIRVENRAGGGTMTTVELPGEDA